MTLALGGAASEPATLGRLARLADGAGLDAIWVGDHVVFPPRMPSNYPYTGSGSYVQNGRDGWLDAFPVLSYLAAITQHTRLGISVLIIPYRNPVVMSKLVATLDVLSGGRAILGAGVGWLEDEFTALGADYHARGAVTDEYLEVYRRLCRDAQPTFSGEHYQLPEVVFEPKPLQRPWPPIWVGGHSTAALRRAARIGDGWQPIGLTPEGVVEARSRLRAECERAGRDEALDLSMRCFFHIEGTRQKLDRHIDAEGELIGSASAIADAMRRYRDAGLDHLIFTPLMRHDAQAYIEQNERFVADVVAAVGAD